MLSISGIVSLSPIYYKALSMTGLGFAFMPKQEIEALSFDSNQQEKFDVATLYFRILKR